MRVLHTSDWHLGRTFHGGQLLTEQTEMVDAIVAIAVEQSVDAVIIAGDLFDRAIPSVEAVELWEQAVARLRATGATVIAIAGNHDSARRVSVHSRLLEAGGVIIRGAADTCDEPIVLSGADGPTVAVYAIPYLDPVVARGAFGDAAFEPLAAVVESGEAGAAGELVADDSSDDGSSDGDSGASTTRRRVTHHSITRAATDRIRADLAERGSAASIVVAHTFVSGGSSSESERDITLGNVENVPLDVFDGFTYVALGHLHGPQAFDGGRIVYSGSPLPYSFSEQSHHKSVRIVTIDADHSMSVETVSLELSMRLATIEGELETLLSDPSLDDLTAAYVRAHLTDLHLPSQAMSRLRTRFPKAVELRHRPAGVAEGSIELGHVDDRRELPPLELATNFFAEQEQREATTDELDLIRDALAFSIGGDR